MSLLPASLAADERKLVKRITDYYKARGTRPSFPFIMRALFGRGCTTTNPADDLFDTSGNQLVVDDRLPIISFQDAIDRSLTNLIRRRQISSLGLILPKLKFAS
jgi:hypothetical protein